MFRWSTKLIAKQQESPKKWHGSGRVVETPTNRIVIQDHIMSDQKRDLSAQVESSQHFFDMGSVAVHTPCRPDSLGCSTHEVLQGDWCSAHIPPGRCVSDCERHFKPPRIFKGSLCRQTGKHLLKHQDTKLRKIRSCIFNSTIKWNSLSLAHLAKIIRLIIITAWQLDTICIKTTPHQPSPNRLFDLQTNTDLRSAPRNVVRTWVEREAKWDEEVEDRSRRKGFHKESTNGLACQDFRGWAWV